MQVDRKVLEQALEALEPMQNDRDDTAIQRTIIALKAVLEQKAECDGGKCGLGGYCDGCPNRPVAWQWLNTAHFRKKLPADAEPGAWNPLYTHPPRCEWQSLTDEERDYFKACGFVGVSRVEEVLRAKNSTLVPKN